MTAAPGWYPDGAGNQRYWTGDEWASFPPPPSETPSNNSSKRTAVAIGVIILAIVGTMMSMQSASLLTGTGPLWTGVGIAGAAVAVAFFLGGAVWVRVVASILLVISLSSVLYMENQMTEKRNELSNLFDN